MEENSKDKRNSDLKERLSSFGYIKRNYTVLAPFKSKVLGLSAMAVYLLVLLVIGSTSVPRYVFYVMTAPVLIALLVVYFRYKKR